MPTRMQELREKAGLSQEDLAAKAGLSVRNLRYIEGGRDVKVSTLRKYAEALGVEVTELLEREGAA